MIILLKAVVEIKSCIFGMRVNYELWKARRSLMRLANRNAAIASKM